MLIQASCSWPENLMTQIKTFLIKPILKLVEQPHIYTLMDKTFG